MILETLTDLHTPNAETPTLRAVRPVGIRSSENRLKGPHPVIKMALSAHYTDFRRYLLRRVGNQATADDILQNFCVQVLKPRAPLRNNDSAVAWLYVVLKSVLMDHFRRETTRRRLETSYAEQQIVLGRDIVEEKVAGLQCSCIKPVINSLRRDYAQILTRIDMRGESREALGKELKISPENLRVRLHRARRAMYKALKLNCDGCCASGFDDCCCK